jgi:hypothetical protein
MTKNDATPPLSSRAEGEGLLLTRPPTEEELARKKRAEWEAYLRRTTEFIKWMD